MTVETRDSEHVREIMTAFAAEGLPMAKIIAGGGDLA